MDIQQTLINVIGIILMIGIIRVVILKPRSITDLIVQLFSIDLLMKVVNEMDFDDWDNNVDWDD